MNNPFYFAKLPISGKNNAPAPRTESEQFHLARNIRILSIVKRPLACKLCIIKHKRHEKGRNLRWKLERQYVEQVSFVDNSRYMHTVEQDGSGVGMHRQRKVSPATGAARCRPRRPPILLIGKKRGPTPRGLLLSRGKP